VVSLLQQEQTSFDAWIYAKSTSSAIVATDFSFGMFEARKGFVIHSQSAFQSIPMDKGCSVFGKPSP